MGREPGSGLVRGGELGCGRLGKRGETGKERCWCCGGPTFIYCPQIAQDHIEGPGESFSSPVVTCLSK